MSYTPNPTWQDAPGSLATPITAGALNHIESGVQAAAATADAAQAQAGTTAATIATYGNIVTHNASDFAPAGSGGGGGDLLAANNLSDLNSVSAARTNLGLGSAATHPATDFLQTANNLSDVTPATARTNLAVPPNTRLVSAGTGLTGGGDLSADRTISMPAVGTAGTYGDSTHSLTITTDAQGRVTAVTANAIAGSTVTANTQTGTAYTLVLGDAGEVIEMNNAAANTVTIPPNSSVAFPVGTIIEVLQYGAGQTTIAAGVGVTLRSPAGKTKTAVQYSSATLRKRATDEWMLEGDIV